MHTDEDKTVRRAREIMATSPLIDGHNDLPNIIRGYYHNKIHTGAFLRVNELVGHVDIKRLRKGCNGGVFWSAYVDCPDQDKENSFDDDGYMETIRETMQQIDLIKLVIDKFPGDLQLAVSAKQASEAFGAGRIASMIGIEGLHQIGNSFSVLRNLYDLGVRYATLTHNHNNAFADSATASEPAHNGLSHLGRTAIQEMNRLGIMVDLSHTSEKTSLDVMQLTKAPVIFSHSSAYGLTPHRRNATDRVLRLLKENSGIIMISFVPEFSSADPGSSSWEHVLDHMLYVGQLIGYDHVGIGSDFDGMAKAVTGLEDVSMMPRIVEGLLERGVDESDVRKIMGYNLLRVMAAVEAVATNMKQAGNGEIPMDRVKPLWDVDFRRQIAALYPNAQAIDFD